jgi:hypothetical protein
MTILIRYGAKVKEFDYLIPVADKIIFDGFLNLVDYSVFDADKQILIIHLI